MPTVLITGANRGIGLELGRQYALNGWRVVATCRNPINVGALAKLTGQIDVYSLDVNDTTQLLTLANELSNIPLDILINNAGIYGLKYRGPENFDLMNWLKVIETNTIAPLNVAKAFVTNGCLSNGKIVTLTSKMGSIKDNTAGDSYVYRSSKAALNSVMKSLAIELTSSSIPVAVLHPGWVQTDMGGENAVISVKESVSGLRQVISELGMHNSGKFFNYDGTEIPW